MTKTDDERVQNFLKAAAEAVHAIDGAIDAADRAGLTQTVAELESVRRIVKNRRVRAAENFTNG